MSSNGYRRYVLFILTLVYTLNFIDRNLIALLLQPIKADLRLSDTQLGFLTGIAFGLFYATIGLPIARLADRGNRVSITAFAIGTWGLTVMGCVVVRNFVQLVFARVAAAVGEAGCMPPTYSLLGDYFPAPADRVRGMAIYWLGAPLSALISFILGGWLSARYGWRLTFFIMGIPGLLIAPLVKLTVREPRQMISQTTPSARASIRQVFEALWRQSASRNLAIAVTLLVVTANGLTPWYAAFMMRSHGMGTAETGIWLGSIFGATGIVGILAGGYSAARWLPDGERAQMRLSAVFVASLAPFSILFLLLPHTGQALCALVPVGVVFVLFIAPAFTLMQRLVATEIRATTMAVVLMFANLVGMGLAPQIVGLLSDFLSPFVGNDSLRFAMMAMSMVCLWSAYHFWKVGDSVIADLRAVAV